MKFEELIGLACFDPVFRNELMQRGVDAAKVAGSSSLTGGQRAFFGHFKTDPDWSRNTAEALAKVNSLILVHCKRPPNC